MIARMNPSVTPLDLVFYLALASLTSGAFVALVALLTRRGRRRAEAEWSARRKPVPRRARIELIDVRTLYERGEVDEHEALGRMLAVVDDLRDPKNGSMAPSITW